MSREEKRIQVGENRKTDPTERVYLQLYPAGKLRPRSLGSYTTEALRTISSIIIRRSEEKSLQVLWEQNYSQLLLILLIALNVVSSV